MDFDAAGIRQILGKKWEYHEAVHHLLVYTSRKPMILLGEVLYKTVIEFGIPMKLARLIEMCQNDTYS
jgi:hypothetical protein